MKKLIIFDLDGTLLDTIADLSIACNHALQKNGLPTHQLDELKGMVGNGIKSLISKAAPGQPEQKLSELLKDFLEYYDNHSTDLTTPYQGIRELLSELKSRDMTLAVCSNKYHKAVVKIIDFFFPDTFTAVYGDIDGLFRKPSPAIIERIMRETGIPKTETLMVGDSEADVEAARRAGVDSAAVTWGFRSTEQLRSTAPTHLINQPIDILNILQ